jgi:hypothetical protein
MLGIAAVKAFAVTVDAAPEEFAGPLGMLFSVLAAGLVLSAVARLLGALFSPASRASIAAHEVVHTVWFGAAGIIVASAFLFKDKMRSFPSSPTRWVVLWSQQPRREGRTIAQWLRIIALEPGRPGSPLDIIRVNEDTNERTTFLEVALSYDLMREHNFLRGVGFIMPLIDGDVHTVECLRGTNGSILIPLSWDGSGIPPGLHEAKVKFLLWTGIDMNVSAWGSARTINFDNHAASH